MHADVDAAVAVIVRHFGVHDALSRCHELEIPGVDGACVAGEVFVVDGAAEEVGYCFLAAVRVVGETRSDGYSAVGGGDRLVALLLVKEVGATYK